MEKREPIGNEFCPKACGRFILWILCNLVSIAGILQFAHYARMGNNRLGICMAVLCIAANRLGELFHQRAEKRNSRDGNDM